jgi:hypothetical protein
VTARTRFEIIAPLPSPRRHLQVAVDHGSHPPRAVVLAFYPRALADDAGRLGRLAGEMERAALLFHPNVLAPVGIEAVGDEFAAVTVWRDAVTVRDVLDAGGRLPPDIAARIAADVCAGLAHAHGGAEPVVHGLLRPDAVLLDGSGTAAVSGFGMPGGSGVPDDLLGVGDLLHECLTGEPPEGPSVPLAKLGIPEPLAAVVNRARAAEPEGRYPTADALGAALAEAVPLAAHETVAAYVEAFVPAGSGVRAERRRKIEAALAATTSAAPEEISEHDIVGAATPPPGAVAVPAAELAPARDRIEADAIPRASPSAAPLPPVIAAATVAAPPQTAATATATPTANPNPTPTATPTANPTATATATPAATPTAPPAAAATPAATPPAPPPAAATPPPPATPLAPAPARAERRREPARGPRVPLGLALAMSLAGVVVGYALARLPWNLLEERTRPAPEARAPGPAAPADPAAPAAPPPRAPPRRAAASAPDKRRESARILDALADAKVAGTGFLDVTAPEGAEVWLDGRRVGTGSTRKEIPEGDHRVEVRYQGAKVAERFHVAPRETWTYAVTPTVISGAGAR